jgi:hypothetical protein
MLLRFRQKFQYGLRVAYWRDVVRPRILRTSPIRETDNATCEIHVLTSNADWLNLIWALKSFYWASGRRYALCIHDDGTLQPSDVAILKSHFPKARLIERKAADQRVHEALADHPRCWQFRQTNLLAPKVFDFPVYLESKRMLLLDSDVLFFSEPKALLDVIENADYAKNCFNSDISSSYTVEPEINSGLALIHGSSLRFDWIEEFLQMPGILQGHFWRIEQTLYALCSSKFGVELLPSEYSVRLGPCNLSLPCRHYVGAIRHLMYGEGIRHLVKVGMLKALS